MQYIKRFNEDQIANHIIEYLDTSVNEGIDIKSLWDKTVQKIKNLSHETKHKVLMHVIGTMLTLTTASKVYNIIRNSNQEIYSIASNVLDSKTKEEKTEKFKAGFEFSLSEEGKDHIKNEEKLRLNAYKIGDGMISIGWGHAEPESTSKFRLGDRISEEEADSILNQDLSRIQQGINKIFTEWSKKGIDIKIDQSMYDALVSIAFNTGVNGLRKSDAMKYLKKGDYKNAGEAIKTLRVSKKFPGLLVRREKESQMFLSGVSDRIVDV